MNNFIALMENLQKQRINYNQDVEMKSYTSFKIGGPAKIMTFPNSVDQIKAVMQCCMEYETPYFVLGKGSNILVSDEGYSGVVINVCGENLQNIQLADNKLVCQSGASLISVCKFALSHGLSGLEFAYGIPGSIGGAAYMNAGAYDGEMKNIIYCCEHIADDGHTGSFHKDKLDFSYRRSIYSGLDYCITSVCVELEPQDPNIIQSKMKELFTRRKDKQPLEYPSAGSVFKRPEGAYAAALIQDCGLKGVSVGGAQVSEKHSGFIINTGNATCNDVLKLIEHVQDVVYKQTGYLLECEVKPICI